MKQEIEKLKKEVAYYKKIAKRTGDLFLRETQELSKLVSMLKKTEAALREKEEKLRNIIEHSDELFYLHDTEHQLTYISPQCMNIFGYTTDEMRVKWTDLLTDNPINKIGFELTEKTIRTGEKQKPYILEGRRKDGQIILLEIEESAIKNESGHVVAITGAARDVTRREKIESDLRQAHKMEAIGKLVGGIAHDFNNILEIIIGNVDLALYDVPEWDPARSNLEAIHSASLRARDVVKQLLSFGRKSEQSRKPVYIDEIVKESLGLLRSSIPRSIEIRSEILDNIRPIAADSTQIQQVIINLCTNSAQAMEEGGGVLTIRLKEVEIAGDAFSGDRGMPEGSYIQLAVSDTGHGIETQIKEKIFDPYFTTRDVGKGNGLGLAVVQGIVKDHGGAISVSSGPGKGTTVNVLFPVCEKTPVAQKAEPLELPSGNETILFVDDEQFIVDMIRQMLERLGYQVETRVCPVEALALFQSKADHFDLVITDMTMPQMNGVELSAKLREINETVPIMICSGYSSLIDDNKAKKLGIAAYLMKPFNMRLIARTIRRVLDNT